MILRHVIEHFRKQEWTAIALDFLIVVVGVFIGIQVANWNGARADVRLGEYYSDRLLKDLQADLERTKIQAAYYTAVLDSVREAERLLSVADPDPRALLIAAYRASEIANNPVGRATWDQIVSSGHLGLLPASVLDSGLSDYYRFTEANVVADDLLQSAPYRRTLRSIIPVPIQLAIRQGCSDDVDDIAVITGFVKECRLDLDDAALEDLAATLSASPSLKGDLKFQYSLVFTVLNNEKGNQILQNRLIDVIEQESRKR